MRRSRTFVSPTPRAPRPWLTRALATLAGLLFMVIAGSEARAETMGMVVVTGKLSTQQRSAIESAITIEVRRAAWVLSVPSFSSNDIDAITTCLRDDRPWRCLNPYMPTGVDRLIIAEAKPQADAPTKLTITGEFVIAGDQSPIVVQRQCDTCSADGLGIAAESLARQLLQDMASLNEQTVLELQTVPAGADVKLDEHSIGATSTTGIHHATYPGPHRLVVEKPGYLRSERTIDVPAGKTTKLVVELSPQQGYLSEHRVLVPAVVGGAGLIAVIAGSWVSATAVPDSPGPQHKYAYSTPGLVVAGAGVVAIGIAAYLWWRNPVAHSAPTAALLPGGGAVGWATTF